MASMDEDTSSPFAPLLADLARMKKSNLSAAIEDVDKIIDLLLAAREQVATDADAHRIGMVMTTLQNPVKAQLEAITSDLKEVKKAQKSFGKALDKALPPRELPMETDAMADNPSLINRAIAMHLLREGQFSVASTFLQEEQEQRHHDSLAFIKPAQSHIHVDTDDEIKQHDERESSMQSLSESLQNKFSEMYCILAQLKQRNLSPAIDWAHANNLWLEAQGSNIEFELCKLQFVWLFRGPAANGLPDDENNGHRGAMAYARNNFARFQSRHLQEIQQLCCAMLYAPNIEASPYHQIFAIHSAFEDIATSFTRDFCSLFGLSAKSPLYVAVTAGAIALPRLIKYTAYMKQQKTEWTTENELAFETPLPESMIYHPIFVCPVSKEQTTDQNPAMMLQCGHVICRDSLQKIAKGSRYKCPYCPTESYMRDALKISF